MILFLQSIQFIQRPICATCTLHVHNLPIHAYTSIISRVRSPKFIWAPCAQLYSLAETPSPHPPAFLGSYTSALLVMVSQDRRNIFVTPSPNPTILYLLYLCWHQYIMTYFFLQHVMQEQRNLQPRRLFPERSSILPILWGDLFMELGQLG